MAQVTVIRGARPARPVLAVGAAPSLEPAVRRLGKEHALLFMRARVIAAARVAAIVAGRDALPAFDADERRLWMDRVPAWVLKRRIDAVVYLRDPGEVE